MSKFSLQVGHQVVQNTIKTGFPLYSLRLEIFPFNPLSEKGGATFLSGNFCRPKVEQDWPWGPKEEVVSARRLEIKKTLTIKMVSRKMEKFLSLIAIPESMPG